ncbi:hypothetical protein Bca52824_000855 [Brassica carinata]|uniref:Uncharacterized protein n=1 Tax=Brassica carinata TaxID=52824 RepID=A0A8X7WI93_BRACI|nr:hypothetical protein Bca52824_000855 [Brassica carinata]
MSAAMDSFSSSYLVLIRKQWGKQGKQFTEVDSFSELDSSSDESSDFDSPEIPRQMSISKFMFKKAHKLIFSLLKYSIRVSTELAETIEKDRRRWAFNFFHADQQETRFPCKQTHRSADHFKLVSRMQTFVEEDKLFYFRAGIKVRQGSKVLNFWSTTRKK